VTLYLPTIPGAVAGFYGKLPVRGDFVRAGLPSSFVTPWDDWMARVLAGSQQSLGDGWRPAWFEAPIWRFALSAGLCGPAGALGLFLPSVDRAGRAYPLTLAVLVEGADARALADAGGAFLDRAETWGLDALEHDMQPEELGERVRAAVLATGESVGPAPPAESGATLWWSEGGPRVPHAAFAHAAMPGADIVTWMIDSQVHAPQAGAAIPNDDPARDARWSPGATP
jgi:type VI secretion system protein ImpM